MIARLEVCDLDHPCGESWETTLGDFLRDNCDDAASCAEVSGLAVGQEVTVGMNFRVCRIE